MCIPGRGEMLPALGSRNYDIIDTTAQASACGNNFSDQANVSMRFAVHNTAVGR